MISSPPLPILTIAGSDSGGGAGIQADIKTIQACGGYAMSAITALTAQNTLGVQAVEPVPAEFVARQISCVLEDIPPKAIKTGMLANAEIIAACAAVLSDWYLVLSNTPASTSIDKNQTPSIKHQAPLIIDPVMIAKGGASLLEEEAVDALKKKLLPLATLVTPNIPEAEVLSDTKINSVEDIQIAGKAILELGCKAVLIKGGHLDMGDEVHNLLLTQAGEKHLLSSPRIDTKHTHGTGCTLSAAIATYLGRSEPLVSACEKAEAYVAGAIQHAPQLGQGHGPLGHGWMQQIK